MDRDTDSGSESDELQEPKMFDGMTAWFSDSVAQKRKHLWVQNDGQLEDWEIAQYVFSEDAQSEDTIRLFESEAYLREHLAIFHPTYIEECLRHGDLKEVALGKFFLPPADIHEAINVKFHWEMLMQKEQEEQEKTPKKTPHKKATTPAKSPKSAKKSTPHHLSPKPGTSRDDSWQRHGSKPRSPKSKTPQKPADSRRSPQLHSGRSPAKRKIQLSPSKGSPVVVIHKLPTKPARDSPTHASPKRAKTRDLDTEGSEAPQLHQDQDQEYMWVDALPKVTEAIRDFVVGEAGCSVYRKTAENG